MTRPVLLLIAAALGACSTSAPRVINRVPIVLTTPANPSSDEIGGMIVPVTFEGRDGALAVDTGSALTFLYTGKNSPPYTPRAGALTIGTQTLELPGRSFESSDKTGARIVGVLGAEFLLGATTEFDPAALTITRFESTPPPDTRG